MTLCIHRGISIYYTSDDCLCLEPYWLAICLNCTLPYHDCLGSIKIILLQAEACFLSSGESTFKAPNHHLKNFLYLLENYTFYQSQKITFDHHKALQGHKSSITPARLRQTQHAYLIQLKVLEVYSKSECSRHLQIQICLSLDDFKLFNSCLSPPDGSSLCWSTVLLLTAILKPVVTLENNWVIFQSEPKKLN